MTGGNRRAARFGDKQGQGARPFQKGVSGNPGGRCGSAMELGRRIRERTGDGLELIDFALAVLRGTGKMPPPATAEPGTPDVGVPDDPKSRMFALDWLTERGWGKAKQVVEVSTGAAIEMPDMTQKTLDELQQIIATELDSESDGDVH